MKFLFVAPRFHTNMYETVKGLIEKGHQVDFYVNRKEFSEDYSVIEPLVLKPSLVTKALHRLAQKTKTGNQLESNYSRIFIPKFSALLLQLIKDKPDIVIVRDRNWLSMAACLACKILRIKKVILYSQSPLYFRATDKISAPAAISFPAKLQKKLQTTLLPRISYTPVETRAALDFIAEKSVFQKKKNKYFIPLVAKSPSLNIDNRSYCPDGRIRIVDVGKFRPYKNHQLFVDAASRLNSEKYEFTIVGQCINPDEKKYHADLVEYIAQSGLAGKINVLANISFAEMEAIYLNHDVLVLTSPNETAAVCICEAMSYGVVPVSPDTNGTATYIDSGDNGFIYRANDLEDLVAKLSSISENASQVTQKGLNAYRKYLSDYSFQSFYANIAQLLVNEFSCKI